MSYTELMAAASLAQGKFPNQRTRRNQRAKQIAELVQAKVAWGEIAKTVGTSPGGALNIQRTACPNFVAAPPVPKIIAPKPRKVRMRRIVVLLPSMMIGGAPVRF